MAVATLIWATPRLSADVQELREVHKGRCLGGVVSRSRGAGSADLGVRSTGLGCNWLELGSTCDPRHVSDRINCSPVADAMAAIAKCPLVKGEGRLLLWQ